MSFHPPPQPTMAPPPLHVGPQGGIIPGYLPPSTLPAGLPPPPMPPPFPGFAVPPPGQTGLYLLLRIKIRNGSTNHLY